MASCLLAEAKVWEGMGEPMTLVTGGAGFIGTHLCRALISAGKSVRSLDIADPSAPVAGVEYRRGDVRDKDTVIQAVRDCESVFHLAAMVSVPECQDQPIESTRTNLLGTVNVLSAIQAEKGRTGRAVRIVFASSSAVYGDEGNSGLPLEESLKLPAARSYYGSQKRASEEAIAIHRSIHRTPGVVFRFFNVYGPGQKDDSPYSGVISLFAKQLRGGLPLKLNGGGSQTRDFVFVADLVAACLRGLEIPEYACDASPINLGSGRAISISQLARTMIQISGRRVPTEIAPSRSGDILHSCASIARAKQCLSWEPAASLEQGLEAVLGT